MKPNTCIYVSWTQMEKKLQLLRKVVQKAPTAQLMVCIKYHISLPHKTKVAKLKMEELLPFLITV